MKESYNKTTFSKLIRDYQTLTELYNTAFECLKLIEELKNNIEIAESNGIKVIETKKLLYLAESSFERGAFKETLERLKEAKLTYAAETKGEFNLIYYIKNNPLESASILFASLIVVYSGSLLTRRALLKRKIHLLKQEQLLLLNLMKVVQRECFELGHLSMEEYETAMNQYEAKLAETIEEEIRAETMLAHLGKIKGKKKALQQEKERLLELIKKAQERYLVKGEMETRIYYNMLKSYSRRLAEVEEEMTFLELRNI
jgi:hypothetical protein